MTYQGSVCRRGHDDGTGHSLRYSGAGNCVACTRARAAAWEQANRAKVRASQAVRRAGAAAKAYARAWRDSHPANNRARHLRKHYGMTAEQYQALLAEQGGCCALCSEAPAPHRRLAVDHDHATGRVRGLLCLQCNVSLGKLGDSIEALERVLAYLRKGAS